MFTHPFEMDRPVLVIGAAGLDIIGRQTDTLNLGTSNPAIIHSSFGGVARNVAENLARLGHECYLLTAIGTDQAGEQLAKYTADSGVDIQYIFHSSIASTGAYLAVLNPHGELQFALDDMRAINEISPGYIRSHAALFKEASLVFFDANLPATTIQSVIRLAKKAKAPICADPTSTTLAIKIKPYLSELDIVIANTKEAGILIDQPVSAYDPAECRGAVRKLVSLGVDLAIVTMAEFGLTYATSEDSGHIPALTTETINPTGAGDALIAAVLFALLNQIPPHEAVRLGVSAASLTLRHAGAVVPDLTLEKLYDNLVI